MALAPNVYDAEPIPEAARAEIDRLLASGDLFRYTAAGRCARRAARGGIRRGARREIRARRRLLLGRAVSVAEGARPAARRPGADPGLHLRRRAVGRSCMPTAFRCWSRWATTTGSTWPISRPSSTGEIDAVIISHMRGHTSDMDAIMALCDARGVPVIEDAAHSARHALAWPQDRHARQDRRVQLPVLQDDQRRRGRDPDHRRRRPRRPRGDHVGRLRAQLEEAQRPARAELAGTAPRPSPAGRTGCRSTTRGCRTSRRR